MTASLDRLEAAVRGWLDAGPRPLVLGLCGSQGSGKSTLAARLSDRLTATGLKVATLSLDDLYLFGDDRAALAHGIHPLLRTRGVPLTHDVDQGLSLIRALKAGQPVRLPRFDKALDEPLPPRSWHPVTPPIDLLIFEGWCVGARPQPDAALADPVNALERAEDADAVWRTAVDTALGSGYATLFAEIDRLVLLAAPGFAVVEHWRAEQEAALRDRLDAEGRDTGGLMDAAAIGRFVQHYERLTRWILTEMPERADLTLRLDEERRLLD